MLVDSQSISEDVRGQLLEPFSKIHDEWHQMDIFHSRLFFTGKPLNIPME